MVCDASKGLKSQENALFYRHVWQGRIVIDTDCGTGHRQRQMSYCEQLTSAHIFPLIYSSFFP